MSRQIGARRKQYPQENMTLAISQVRQGKMSQRQASKVYGIPRMTLADKVTGRVPENGRSGPPLALGKEDEDMMANHVKNMAKAGFPYTKQSLLLEVKRILDHDRRVVPCFKDNLPGKI